MLTIASYIATSTNWALPVSLDFKIEAKRPKERREPEKMSAIPGPTLRGVFSLYPVKLIKPPIAWATTSYEGQFL